MPQIIFIDTPSELELGEGDTFQRGDVAELSQASVDRWIRLNRAKLFTGRPTKAAVQKALEPEEKPQEAEAAEVADEPKKDEPAANPDTSLKDAGIQRPLSQDEGTKKALGLSSRAGRASQTNK